MASFHHLDDIRTLQTKIDEKAPNLFLPKTNQPLLQVRAISRQKYGKENARERTKVVLNEDVIGIGQIKALNDNDDQSQIFTIQQDYSWTTINTSMKMVEGFMSIYSVMPCLWRYFFTFGRKTRENEYEFPGFRRRRSRISGSSESRYEYAYMLRRVELKNRVLEEGESPWAIRQTAVYHSLVNCARVTMPGTKAVEGKSTFLLVAPSPNAEWQLTQCLNRSASNSPNAHALSPWNTHRLLIADSLRGWGDYMASLEVRLNEQTDPIILAEVARSQGSFSPLTNFKLNFEDRQELKIVEDFVLDLQVILPTILESIKGVTKECLDYSKMAQPSRSLDEQYELDAILDELDEYAKEMRMYIDRTRALKEKAASTTQLLSDLLSYEEAITMEDLAQETKIESKAMGSLAERSTKDAAAVKILTVITLVYLPTTMVATFFSTQFVQRNDLGQIQVIGNAWIMAAIAVPLTIFTILVWWGWVFFTKVGRIELPEKPGVVVFQRVNSLKSVLSMNKTKQSERDLEAGALKSPSPALRSAKTSWGSLATVEAG